LRGACLLVQKYLLTSTKVQILTSRSLGQHVDGALTVFAESCINEHWVQRKTEFLVPNDGRTRIILRWGDRPADLDTYVVPSGVKDLRFFFFPPLLCVGVSMGGISCHRNEEAERWRRGGGRERERETHTHKQIQT
jgi:hypothetical protein